MESAPPAHAATGASPPAFADSAASPANGLANATASDAQTAPHESDLWGPLSPVRGDVGDAPPLATMEPPIHVSHALPRPSAAATPFDAFDAFAPPSSSSQASYGADSLVLPPPVPSQSAGHDAVALGSPLLSFSPVASTSTSSSALSLDTTTADTSSAFAVDDLLSFSPVAAAPVASSSSLMMMDDFFLGSTAPSADTSKSQEEIAAFPVETASVEPTTSSLLSFSPLASVPHAPFSDGFATSDLSGFSRESFGGFDGEATIDHVAPRSAPAAFARMGEMEPAVSEDAPVDASGSAQEEVESREEDDATEVEEAAEAHGGPTEVQDDRLSFAGAELAIVANESTEELRVAVAEPWVCELRAYEETLSPTAVGDSVEGDVQTVEDEDQTQQLPIEYVPNSQLVIEAVEISPKAESASESVQDLDSPSSSHAVPEVYEHAAEVTAVITESPEAEVAERGSFETSPTKAEVLSEAIKSPLQSATGMESPVWQAQESPEAAPVAEFEALSTSSGRESQTSIADEDQDFAALEDDGNIHFTERQSDVFESQFESEATALYAEVEDDDLDGPPALNIAVAHLRLPLPAAEHVQSPENRVATPSSVVSSPGSSVAGSAFAFISGGTSAFSFVQTAPSPQSEPVERASFEGENDRFSPVGNSYETAPEEAHEAVKEQTAWESTRHHSEFNEPATAEFQSKKDFDGFNDTSSGTEGYNVAISSSTSNTEVSFGVQSPCEVSHEDAEDGFGGFNDATSPVSATPETTSSFVFNSTVTAPSPVEAKSSFGFLSSSQNEDIDEDDANDGFGGFNDAESPVSANSTHAAPAVVHAESAFSYSTEPIQSTFGDTNSSFSFLSSSQSAEVSKDGDDSFGDFNDSTTPHSASTAGVSPTAVQATSSFQFEMTTQTAVAASTSAEMDSSFGFASSSQTPKIDEDDDDGFGGFGQSTAAGDDDEDDGFGDFGTASAWGASTVAGNADEDEDDFGDFTPSSASQQWGESTSASTPASTSSSDWGSAPYVPQPVVASIPAPTDLNEFFASAFPASKAPVATSLLPKPTPLHGSAMPTMTASAIFDHANGGAVHKSFHGSLQEYRTVLTTEHDEHPHQHQPSFESEALRLKYLKYVLTEKLTEASRPDGVFPHGSEKYHLFASIAESSHEKNMRDALAQLQEGLFQGSVNEAVMRIAKQAALSAKARIAEQAAQQQAHARGSLLATTRHFLSRSAGGSASSGPGSVEKDGRGSRTGSGSLGVLTPTSASVHKISRFSFQNGQESEVGNSSGYGSGEDTGSDMSVGEASGHSEGDVVAQPSSGPPSGSSKTGGGGLMKKFHERLTSFSSTKQRPRTVSLRRMGQSSEDVVKMELHMESINGGFDEVKWRCAVYLYESEEVAHLAPSQIKILAYPSNQLLSGKSDRSALSKFFKPGTIWSIDIGASSNAGVSME